MTSFIPKLVAGIAIATLIMLPMMVDAQQFKPRSVQNVDELLAILRRIAQWIFTILVIVTVIFGIIAAYQYITATGDPEKLQLARTNTLYALIALAIGILAFSIPTIVCQIVGLGSCGFFGGSFPLGP